MKKENLDVMCNLPIDVVKDLVKAYWWSSSDFFKFHKEYPNR